MALACLAAEADHAGERLARQGYALIDGSGVDLQQVLAAFDALGATSDELLPVAPEHPLVALLLAQPVVQALAAEAVGPGATVVSAVASDRRDPGSGFVAWHQPTGDAARCIILRWHLDLIGPADGGLRALPGSHLKGRLQPQEIARLALEIPAAELAVSAGTVLALRPLLVQGARRRTTRGHRRILQVELSGK